MAHDWLLQLTHSCRCEHICLPIRSSATDRGTCAV